MPNSSSYELHRPEWIDNDTLSAYPIKNFLGKEDNLDIYFIPHDVVLKKWFKMYIKHENDDQSPLFKKEYQLDAPEAGPLLALVENLKVLDYIRCARDTTNEEERLHALNSIGLRFFTPKEVANLMLYPDHFSFPSEISVSQMYKSLVNSMNVYVVSCLMKLLFQTPD